MSTPPVVSIVPLPRIVFATSLTAPPLPPPPAYTGGPPNPPTDVPPRAFMLGPVGLLFASALSSITPEHAIRIAPPPPPPPAPLILTPAFVFPPPPEPPISGSKYLF